MHAYNLRILFLDCNKNSSAPPQSANSSSRMMIMGPNTPPIRLVYMFMSLTTIFFDSTEAGIVDEFT